MPLTCYCDWEPEAGQWYSYYPNDYSILDTKRRRRCNSCNNLINVGATCAEFIRFKIPEYDIEINIYGEDGEIPLSSHYFCETCADLFFSLYELGFECITSTENMHEMVKEYAQNYGPQATKFEDIL